MTSFLFFFPVIIQNKKIGKRAVSHYPLFVIRLITCVYQQKLKFKYTPGKLVSQFPVRFGFETRKLYQCSSSGGVRKPTCLTLLNMSLDEYTDFLAENRKNGMSCCEITAALWTQFGMRRGFSERNVRRWCAERGLVRDFCPNSQLAVEVAQGIAEVRLVIFNYPPYMFTVFFLFKCNCYPYKKVDHR